MTLRHIDPYTPEWEEAVQQSAGTPRTAAQRAATSEDQPGTAGPRARTRSMRAATSRSSASPPPGTSAVAQPR